MTPTELPIPAGIEHDPEIYAAVKKLAIATVDAAIDVLDTGSPAVQMQMIRIVLPRFTSSLNAQKGDGNDELRGRVETMFGAVAEALTQHAVNPDAPVAHADPH
jgi:hypothetical protein